MKNILLITILVTMISCINSSIKPISFNYKDNEIALEISFDSLDKKNNVYHGNLTLTNLSSKKIVASRRDLKICLKDKNNNEIYPIVIGTIASVAYYAEPEKKSSYKIFLKAKEEIFKEKSEISVINRIFENSTNDLQKSLSECE